MKMRSIIILAAIFGVFSSSEQQQEKLVTLLEIGNFDQCQGKDATNFTYVCQYQLDTTCTRLYDASSDGDSLIACLPNGQKTVNSIKFLAQSKYPAGAYHQYEALYLITSGNLQGKFAYVKEIGLSEAYLKKCSSVLGYSFTSTQSHTLLIADKLDLNIFLNPGGAFETFKKSASTFCQGKTNTF